MIGKNMINDDEVIMSGLKINQFETKYKTYFSVVTLLIMIKTTQKCITCNLHFTTYLSFNDSRNSSLHDCMLYVCT